MPHGYDYDNDKNVVNDIAVFVIVVMLGTVANCHLSRRVLVYILWWCIVFLLVGLRGKVILQQGLYVKIVGFAVLFIKLIVHLAMLW